VRYRWIVLAVGVLGTMVTGALRQGMPALAPEFREVFGLSIGEVGLVFAALTAGFTVALVPFGALADRAGERPVLGGGLLATAAALALTAQAGGFAALLAGLFVTGAAGASANGASGRAVMGWFGRRERGLALGVRQTAIPLGGALASLTLPGVALAASLDAALLVLAAFAVVAGVVALAGMREPPPAPPGRPVVDAPPPTRDARLWRLGVGGGMLIAAQVAVIGFAVLFLTDVRGMSIAAAGAVLAVIQLGSGAGRIAAGVRSDHTERRVAPMRTTALAGAALLAGVGLAAEAPTAVLLPVLVAAGIVVSSWNGLAVTAAAEMSGRGRAGTAMSLVTTVLSVIGIFAPPLFGALVEATSWSVAFTLVAVAPVAGWWVLRPLEGEEDDRAAARARRLAAAPT
jgi:sugar phosphate permease